MKSGSDIAKSLDKGSSLLSREEMISAMRKNPDFAASLAKNEVTDEELKEFFPLILSSYEDLLACSKCPGYSSCPKEIIHTTSYLRREKDGIIGRFFGSCAIRAEKERLESSYLVHDFPDEYLESHLVNLLKSDKETKDLINKLSLSLNSPKSWAFIHGEEGSGKSYAIASFTNSFAVQGASIAFLDTPKRLDELKGLSIKDKIGFEKTMKEYEEADFLILDNFGTEFKSEYLRDQVLLPLLNARSSNDLPTYFLSSFSLNEIITLYSSVGSLGASRIQGAALSRLFEKNIGCMAECYFKVESLLSKKRRKF